MRSIDDYFEPYGTLAELRAHNLRSFFQRIRSPFDLPDGKRTNEALQPFRAPDGTFECAYCPATAEEWDHLEEASDGGSHQIGNLVPACKSCNRRRRPWHQHLTRVNACDVEKRRLRIEAYISLKTEGYTLFSEEQSRRLTAAEDALFQAIADVDKVISEAITNFLEKHPPTPKIRKLGKRPAAGNV